jgi:hypothetical protein
MHILLNLGLCVCVLYMCMCMYMCAYCSVGLCNMISHNTPYIAMHSAHTYILIHSLTYTFTHLHTGSHIIPTTTMSTLSHNVQITQSLAYSLSQATHTTFTQHGRDHCCTHTLSHHTSFTHTLTHTLHTEQHITYTHTPCSLTLSSTLHTEHIDSHTHTLHNEPHYTYPHTHTLDTS